MLTTNGFVSPICLSLDQICPGTRCKLTRDMWNSSQLCINIGTLHSLISVISHSRLQISYAGEVANYFANSMKEFLNNNSSWNLLINVGIIGSLIIFLLFLIPVIFTCLGWAVWVAQREIHTLHLLNKKARNDMGWRNMKQRFTCIW